MLMRREINLRISISFFHEISMLSAAAHVLGRTLIAQMLEHDAADRPKVSTLLKHPFFWDQEKQLMFFQVRNARQARSSRLGLDRKTLFAILHVYTEL